MPNMKDIKWERLGVCEASKAWIRAQTTNSTVVTRWFLKSLKTTPLAVQSQTSQFHNFHQVCSLLFSFPRR